MTDPRDDWTVCPSCGEQYRPPPYRCPYCARKAGPGRSPPIGHVDRSPPLPAKLVRDEIERGVSAIHRDGQKSGWVAGYNAGFAEGGKALSRRWFFLVWLLSVVASFFGGHVATLILNDVVMFDAP